MNFRFILSLCVLGGLSACSGRNIHSELTEDRSVLMREWSRPTSELAIDRSLVPGGARLSDAGVRGTEYSNPVLFQNTLLFGNQSYGLQSIYPIQNLERFRVAIPGGILSELTLSPQDNSVIFVGGDGFLYSVDAQTGKIRWTYELRNPGASQPTISQGRVFLTGTDDTVYAFDAGTGKWLWHFRRRSVQSATVTGASKPLVDGGEVLAGLSDGFLVALNVEDGSLKWERKLHTGSRFTDVDATPVLDAGILYVPSYDGSLYALKRKGGEVLWRFDAGGTKSVVIRGEKIFFASSDGAVYALQKNNAKVLWKFELDRPAPTGLILSEKLVIFGSSHQYLYAVDADTGKGLYRWNAGMDSGFAGTPAYDSKLKAFYILSHGGNLMGFKVMR